MSRSILVYGATGKQGGALIRSLLKQNTDFSILALTRDASSRSAQQLAASSPKVSIIEGNMDDTEAVFAKAQKITPSIWGVFAVLMVNPGKEKTILEEHRGIKLVNSAIKYGVQRFVYTSAGRGGNQPTNVPHFATKHNIEQHLMHSAKSAAMSWTILRPVAFMDNIDGTFFGKVFATGWKSYVRSQRLQLVATEDIGRVGAKVFQEPDAFTNQIVNIAGDSLTFEEMANIYKKSQGIEVPTTFPFVTALIFGISKELSLMYDFFEREGFGVDLDETRKGLPEVQNFEAWLRRNEKKQ